MPKKIPMRQCVGCREMKQKSQLVRVVKSPQGDIQLDPSGKLPGRGAYLCVEEACLKKTQKIRALERGFSAPIAPEIFQALEQSLETLRKEVASHEHPSS